MTFPRIQLSSLALFIAIGLSSSACSTDNNTDTTNEAKTVTLDQQLKVRLKNPLNNDRLEQTIRLSKEQIASATRNFNFNAFKVFHHNQEIPSQAIDSDLDGNKETLLFNVSLSALEQQEFVISFAAEGKLANDYPKRTHAELSIHQGGTIADGKYKNGSYTPVTFQQKPKHHVIGDQQFKFEGPGWESDKIAYRLYFDERNVIDIFGKKTSDIVLPQVGQPGTNYHQMADWGKDILKVGDSLGIGGIAMLNNDQVHKVANAKDMSVSIVDDGPIASGIVVKHHQWQVADQYFDLTSHLSINAGSHLTKNQLTVSPKAKNLVTGIVKHANTQVFTSDDNTGTWSYIATYGKQSDIKDELGMAIIYRNNSLIKKTEDQKNHLIVMKPTHGSLEYYLLANWIQEPNGIQSSTDFKSYLDQTISELNNEIIVKVLPQQNLI